MQFDLVLKVLLDKNIQKLVGATILLCFSFIAGRISVVDCKIDEVCFDIIKDRDMLSKQLDEERKNCLEEKTNALKKLKDKLDLNCQLRVDDILEKIEFYPEVHCEICKAKGHCK